MLKVKVQFSASEGTHWNVCAGKLVMPARVVLLYNFIVLLIFCVFIIFCYYQQYILRAEF